MRPLLLRLLLSATVAPTLAHAQTQPATTPTAAALATLDALAPTNGWLTTPPGLSDELWTYYRREYTLDPTGNELDDTRVALGRLLFFEQRLSRDRTLSCASCHDPRHAFAEPRPTSIGIDGQKLTRNAPTLLNVALQKHFFWDGRASSLEAQAAGPILNPAEMGMPGPATVVARIAEVPEYVALFELAYGRAPQFDDIARALAAFQRTLVFVDSPFDAFRAGKQDAISEDARRGFALFAEHCRSCHPISLRAPLLSDGNFHNVGIGFDNNDHRALAHAAFSRLRGLDRAPTATEPPETEPVEARPSTAEVPGDVVGEFGELGRALLSKLEYQVGSFRTAPLRNVALTAPYMHDGSLATLWQVVDHYNQGGRPNPWQDPQIRKLQLSDAQVDQLVAFLFSLTDNRLADANARALAAQQRAARRRP
ncbi:MAG: cytochrome-c peroxidase [Planctomycetes bacterium]|nr:cytochrome-c peroxidase [Planctomycetota bacterium]